MVVLFVEEEVVKEYSKTVLGCKENRRYEMGVQKMIF